MAFSLAEFAKLDKNEMRAGVIATLLRYSQIMDLIPWENSGSLKTEATRWNTLPTVGFRQINAVYTANEGTYDQIWESVYPFGGKISFDRIFTLASNVLKDPVADQTEMKLKSLAMTWNYYFINGDHGSDPDGFEGLKKRIAAMPTRQTVYAAGSGAAALDPTASAANARAFLDAWEKSVKYCNGGQCNAIFMNEEMYLGFTRVLRYLNISGGGIMDVTQDNFGRQITTYKGIPFIDVGYKSDLTTEIITDTETAGDSGSDATSVYFASYDPVEGMCGLQMKDMDILDDQSSGPLVIAKVIDWITGLASWGKYGLVRMANCEGASNWT